MALAWTLPQARPTWCWFQASTLGSLSSTSRTMKRSRICHPENLAPNRQVRRMRLSCRSRRLLAERAIGGHVPVLVSTGQGGEFHGCAGHIATMLNLPSSVGYPVPEPKESWLS